MGVLLKPLRVKKRHHSRKKKRKQKTGGSKQGKRGKEIRAARERGPVFPATQARGLLAQSGR
uniref:hypothetical protein n=1 Tax=Klebsiella pneumoniae TaxID=573 RepID=UPI00155D8AAD|nr:hypothetical protein [Klebsiella pneumoniae]